VIKTIPIDHILSYLVGSLFPLVFINEVKEKPLFNSTVFYKGLCFQVFVFLPIGYYLVLRWPDWSWMYFIDYRDYPVILTYIAVGFYLVSFLLGYSITGILIKRGLISFTYIITGLFCAGCLALFLFGRENLFYLGRYNEFVEKTAEPFYKNKDFVLGFVIIGIYFFVPLLLIFRKELQKRLSHPPF